MYACLMRPCSLCFFDHSWTAAPVYVQLAEPFLVHFITAAVYLACPERAVKNADRSCDNLVGAALHSARLASPGRIIFNPSFSYGRGCCGLVFVALQLASPSRANTT